MFKSSAQRNVNRRIQREIRNRYDSPPSAENGSIGAKTWREELSYRESKNEE